MNETIINSMFCYKGSLHGYFPEYFEEKYLISDFKTNSKKRVNPSL